MVVFCLHYFRAMASSSGSERMNGGFWEAQIDVAKSKQVDWYKNHVNNQNDSDFSAGGRLNGGIERVVGSRFLLAGEMVDQFLQEIGKAIMEKLSRSKSTGELQATSLFVPPRVMLSIEGICIGCGVKSVIRVPGKA